MILRSVVFLAVCAPIWTIYSLHETDQDKQLPVASAMAWTGVHGTLCFAGPISQNRGRMMTRGGRRIRIVRKRRRPVRVPAVCIVDAANALPVPARPAELDLKTWRRVFRILNGPPAAESALPPAKRPVLRRSRVKFFDGRSSFCGIGGVLLENPKFVPTDAGGVDSLPNEALALDDRRRTG
ncbi:MAG: hypothetical protein QM754_07415 [Tepidisphaeraceae bacterium]